MNNGILRLPLNLEGENFLWVTEYLCSHNDDYRAYYNVAYVDVSYLIYEVISTRRETILKLKSSNNSHCNDFRDTREHENSRIDRFRMKGSKYKDISKDPSCKIGSR